MHLYQCCVLCSVILLFRHQAMTTVDPALLHLLGQTRSKNDKGSVVLQRLVENPAFLSYLKDFPKLDQHGQQRTNHKEVTWAILHRRKVCRRYHFSVSRLSVFQGTYPDPLVEASSSLWVVLHANTVWAPPLILLFCFHFHNFRENKIFHKSSPTFVYSREFPCTGE